MDNKEAVKRLLLLLGRYKKTIVVIVGCLLVSTGLNLCVPLISRRIMDDGSGYVRLYSGQSTGRITGILDI